MSIPVFKAYDIRGLSPDELDEEFSRRLVRALMRLWHLRTLMLGRDMRVTSPLLETAFVAEATRLGVNVTRIGLCSTPLFNVTMGLSNGAYNMGVMITASHNPGKYNGFKLIHGDVSPIGQGSGMEELAASFEMDAPIELVLQEGQITEDVGASVRYVEHVLKLAELPAEMPQMKVAIDCGNGMAGYVLPAFFDKLPWLKAERLYFELDGNFPNHEANPIKRETLADLSRRVVEGGYAFGAAFDGDADRIGFVDEKGEPIAGDIMLALLAGEVLRKNPGGLVLYDVRSSWAVPEAIKAAGGQAHVCKVGHAFIKRQMREERAVFGGEVSMHYYFYELFNVESSDLVLLLLVKLLARDGRPLSVIRKDFERYAHSGEINFEVADKPAVLARLHAMYLATATTVSELDGLRLEFRDVAYPENDWWFNVRASNTEPVLRLNVETRTAPKTAEKIEELSRIINMK